MKLSIEVTSDFICPWCRIAEARLDVVLKTLPEDVEVEVNWLPFELNPDMPLEGMDRVTYRSRKFGSWDYSQKLDAHTEEAAAGDDVKFNYTAMKRVPNTRAAHRLIWLAGKTNMQTILIERLFRAYFQEGKDIGDHDVLADIASEAGMNRLNVKTFLAGHDGEAEVIQQEYCARRNKINSVPSFNIGGVRVSGAVSAEILIQHINEAINNQSKREVKDV
ncbi:DsbA family oxidoreductase [Enterobacter wuhouensis]|uniref:DsbA family oxidoreductase n=1 Tax=Enterobacter wuhouensis TaxID=2529381 RepID=A0ABZ1DIV0_9ENTR|nr:DsbA family oxidoreductase [Enterobacter wuhouensis]WRW31683.1 DsbA family oxidoreductase [Enterobacter wuhouensis]